MKIKINWGWGIVIFLGLFIGSIVWRVVITSHQKINLVTPDYYPKGIAYDKEIEKQTNYEHLNNKLVVSQTEEDVVLLFPRTDNLGGIEGTVLMYRPADYEDDSTFVVLLPDSNSVMIISKGYMKKGIYKVKAEWSEDDLDFTAEKGIFIKK